MAHVCFVPNFLHKERVSNRIPESMMKEVNLLKSAKTKSECLKKAYNIVTNRYQGSRVKTYIRIADLFKSDINDIWNKEGFLHCDLMNYILRTLLIKSGKFKESDIRQKHTFIWFFSPHQYLQVKTEKGWTNVDCWAKRYRTKFGDYARGFK